MTPPYCDDCGPKLGLPIDDPRGVRVRGFYGRCGHCKVIRACHGIDPDPIPIRRPNPARQHLYDNREGT